MAETLVINASPLIFLGNAGLLDLLKAGGASRFLVPSSVLDEVMRPGHFDRAAQAVAEALWLERASVERVSQRIVEWDLGPGESAVIATCLRVSGARPVLDDLAARKCARSFGLSVIGTVGLVVAASRLGQIDDARKVLLELRSSGMWLADSVIDRALQLAASSRD